MAKKKDSLEKSAQEKSQSNREDDLDYLFGKHYDNKFEPMVITAEEHGRVSVSMTRNQAFDLYAEMYRNENKFGSFVRIPFENLLKDFFVKGNTVVSSEDLY